MRLHDIATDPIVERAQLVEDAGLLVDRGAAPRLGRVGGHHQTDLRALQQSAHRLGAGTDVDHLVHGGGDRAGARSRRLTRLARPDAAHALVVLGEVDQLEPARERADQQLKLREVQLGDHLRELVTGVGVAVAGLAGELHRTRAERERLAGAGRVADLVEGGAEQLEVGL